MVNSKHLDMLNQGIDCWNNWRDENPSIRPDLKGADLSGKVLSTTNSPYSSRLGVRINLRNTNLEQTNLKDSVLQGAFLKGASFRGADLTGANLRKADVRLVDFTGAKLNQVNFTLARIWKTIFTKSYIWETIFSRVDLTQAIGLSDCIQPGPSVIDDRTLRDSKRVPDSFLKGCGFEDWQISASKLNDKSLATTEINDICYDLAELRSDPLLQFYSCFISYSHADKKFALRLFEVLQDAGIRCWLDEHQILPGDDIYDQVDNGIRLWDKILLCCSKSSLQSWWVDNEVLNTFEKEQALMADRGEKILSLIPLNLDGQLFSEGFKRGYKNQLHSRLAADFSNWENDAAVFETQAQRLVQALRADKTAREMPPRPKL